MGAAAKQAGSDVDDLDKKTEKARDEFGLFKKATDDVTDSATPAAKEVVGLGDKVEETGRKSTKAGDDVKSLRQRMDELEQSLKTTGTEFARNADPDLLKKFKADSRELSGLKSTVSLMEKLGVNVEQLGLESSKAAPSIGSLFSTLFGGGIGGFLTSPPGLVLGGATAIVGAGALGGLATLAGGLGGAGLGIAGAVMGDPQEFKQHWDPVVADLKGELIDAGQAFRGPALAAVDSLDAAIKKLNLSDVLAPAAAFVRPLADGAEQFLLNVEGGVKSLIADAGPVIATFSKDLPELGKSIEDALQNIGSQAQGGADGLHALDTALGDVIEITGGVVAGAEAISGAITDASQSVRGFFDDIPAGVRLVLPWLQLWKLYFDAVTDDTHHGNDAVGGFGHTLGLVAADARNFQQVGSGAMDSIYQRTLDATKVIERMEKDFDDAANSVLGLRDAEVAAAQGLADLAKGFKAGSDALDVNSQKGRDNISLIDKTISGYVKQRDAAIRAGGGTADAYAKANAVYDKQIANLEALLIKLGLSKKAADAFLDAFKDKTVTITVKVTESGPTGQPIGGIPLRGAFAEGGDVPGPGLYKVGERGPEIVAFQGGEHVFTATQTRSMMASSTPYAAGGGTIRHEFAFAAGSGGGNLERVAGTAFMEMLRTGKVQIRSSQILPN